MKSISKIMPVLPDKAVGYRGKVSTSKAQHAFQLLGEEISAWFKQSLHWVFYKYPQQWIYEAYRECVSRSMVKPAYFLAILRNRYNKTGF